MPENNQKILICEECGGTGELGRHNCQACHGHGTGIVMGNYFLFWGGVFSLTDVAIAKLKRVINKIIDFIILLFIVFGFLNFIYYAYIVGFHQIFTNIFWFSPNPHLFIFFLSLFFLLYFGFRATRLLHKFESPLKLKFKEKAKFVKSFFWDGIKDFKHKDISNSFSISANKAVENAFYLAKKYKSKVNAEFLFLSLLNEPKIKIIFGRLGRSIKLLKDKVLRNLAEGNEKNISIDFETLEILFNSYKESVERGANKLEVNIILLELVKKDKFLLELLYDLNIDLDKLSNVVLWIDVLDALRYRWMMFRKASIFKPRGDVNRAMTSLQTPTLNRFSEDLTHNARRGAIDICIGREDIFEKIFRIIEGGGKGVVLVGETGVGKGAIFDGLAEKMIKEDVPKDLQDRRLVKIALSEVLGGATGSEAGKNIMAIMNDIARSGSIVLGIPNLEYFKSSNNISDVALFAEELANQRLPIIATTTPEGYKDVVEGSGLTSIFEKVEVLEPDFNLAIQILEAESATIEYERQVFFSYDAIKSAVELSDKYMHESFLPAKALEVIKEAALLSQKNKGVNSIVTKEDVAIIISEKSKVPVTDITESEREKLLKLEEVIHNRIIGQVEAVDAVSRALRRARAGMHEGKRPIASFLFLGPTGVGKTELAKAISESYFGNEDVMIRLDMSEYQDKPSVARMIGAGGERGYLTEAVRKQPFALILLDELEKAHPDILNLFLQVLEDGRLTDGRGKTIDFTNTILIATSNAESSYISSEVAKGIAIPQITEVLLRNKLASYFRPEFLNRFDGVMVFRPLKEDEIVKIASLLVVSIAKKISSKGIELIVEDGALKELAKMGFDPKFGARPLRRVIAREVEDRLANMILKGKLKRRDRVVFKSLDNIEIVSAKSI